MSFWSELHNFTCLSLSNTGWWFGTWILFSIISGMSSFPLTFIFFKMVKTTNQTVLFFGAAKYPYGYGSEQKDQTGIDEQLLKHSIILLYMLWTFLLMLIGGPGVLLHTHILEAINRTLQQKLLNYSKSSEIRYSNSKKLIKWLTCILYFQDGMEVFFPPFLNIFFTLSISGLPKQGSGWAIIAPAEDWIWRGWTWQRTDGTGVESKDVCKYVCNHFYTTHFLTHVNISHNTSFSPLFQGFSWFFFPPGCSTTRWGMGQALQGPRCSQRPTTKRMDILGYLIDILVCRVDDMLIHVDTKFVTID